MRDGMATGYRWWFGYPIPGAVRFSRSNLPAGFAISSAEDMAHFLIAQMNGGRYEGSVLSPNGTAFMHDEPPPGRYGNGWESVRIDGRRFINHDGATPNYQCSVFIDREERIGVFVAANAMNGLDGLSSSRSTASLGPASALITTRDMALSTLDLAAGRPLPRQGPGMRRVSLVFNLAILLLTGALIASLLRLPDWYGRLATAGVRDWSDLGWRIAAITAVDFTLPLVLLYVVLRVPYWIFFALYQPDLALWVEAVAATLALRGSAQIALVARLFRQVR